MKKILTIIAATVCATSLLYAQGTVLFDTSKAAGAKVLEATGYGGAGSAIGNTVAGSATGTQFLMQLYGVAGTATDSSSLLPLGFAVNARGGTINGGFSQITGTTTLGTALTTVNTTLSIPVTPAGGTATVQLRAWWAGGGATPADYGKTYTSYYSVEDTSATAALMRSGYSSLLILNVTGNPLLNPPGTPVDLIGLTGFQLTDVPAVPEPSTFALLGLGALGMLLFRRK